MFIRDYMSIYKRLHATPDYTSLHARMHDKPECLGARMLHTLEFVHARMHIKPKCLGARMLHTLECVHVRMHIKPECLEKYVHARMQARILHTQESVNVRIIKSVILAITRDSTSKAHNVISQIDIYSLVIKSSWNWLDCLKTISRLFASCVHHSKYVMQNLYLYDSSFYIYPDFTLFESVSYKCSHVALLAQRHIFLKHDFKAYLIKYNSFPFMLANRHCMLYLFSQFPVHVCFASGDYLDFIYISFFKKNVDIFKMFDIKKKGRLSSISHILHGHHSNEKHTLADNSSGYRKPGLFSGTEVTEPEYFSRDNKGIKVIVSSNYRFIHHTDTYQQHVEHNVVCHMSLHNLLPKVSLYHIKRIAHQHDIRFRPKSRKTDILQLFKDHRCDKCNYLYSVFEPITRKSEKACMAKQPGKKSNNEAYTADKNYQINKTVGGGRPAVISGKDIISMATEVKNNLLLASSNYRFIKHTDSYDHHIHNNVVCLIPLDKLLPRLSLEQSRNIAEQHNIHLTYRMPKNHIAGLFEGHCCAKCDHYFCL